MSQRNWVVPLVLTSVDTVGIAINTWSDFATGIEGSCFMVRISNDSDTDVFISFNGGDDRHEFIPAGDTISVNFQSNASPPSNIAKLRFGTQLSVQGVAGTGLVYLAGYYNEPFEDL